MSKCSDCNMRINDDDFCLIYSRHNPVHAENIRLALTGKCNEYIKATARALKENNNG